MGGCCCCFKDTPPAQNSNPTVPEEHVHLPQSSHHGAPPAVSEELLNDTNLENSSPDTSSMPLAHVPVSSNVPLGATQTSPVAQEICGDQTNKSLQATSSNSTQETVAGDNYGTGTSSKSEKLKESECRVQTALKIGSAMDSEIELSKLAKPDIIVEEEEDECPICLKEYDAGNPKLSTKCGHHFHPECILGWIKRRNACPVCDRDVEFNSPIH